MGDYTDFRKRCARDAEVDGLECVVIRYGVTAEETRDLMGIESHYELPDANYRDLSIGGRRSGRPIENERGRHFFNKRIMTDEERVAGRPAVQGRGDVGGVSAPTEAGGSGGVADVDRARGDSAAERGPGGDGDGHRSPASETNCCLCGGLLKASEYQICRDCDFQTG